MDEPIADSLGDSGSDVATVHDIGGERMRTFGRLGLKTSFDETCFPVIIKAHDPETDLSTEIHGKTLSAAEALAVRELVRITKEREDWEKEMRDAG